MAGVKLKGERKNSRVVDGEEVACDKCGIGDEHVKAAACDGCYCVCCGLWSVLVSGPLKYLACTVWGLL